MSENSIRAVPLHIYGDAIVDAAEKLGVARPCVIVILADSASGNIITISNVECDDELKLLKVVLDSRLEGSSTVVDIPAQVKH